MGHLLPELTQLIRACHVFNIAVYLQIYIVDELHEQKAALERKVQAKARKRRTDDNAPLEKPMKHWEKLSIPEKHELAAVMLEAVYVSDENGIEVKFSI